MRQPLDPDMFTECETVPSPIRVGDKWTVKIVYCLRDGPRRFSELQRPLRGITPKVLTESLRAMERDGLLSRTEYAQIPPRVEYELTALGRSLLEPIAAGCAWNRRYLADLRSARQAYAERAVRG
ncbi:winged helix-turn-helix transcriptional regulator [Plantactinospora sp. GCM10030261]|uniref:winged helix-turn-helix transcriptional regulator n=1 Tax=Plantactinospora sp. GCM10030261 TaxID=3273420 RepID=UPI00360FB68E